MGTGWYTKLTVQTKTTETKVALLQFNHKENSNTDKANFAKQCPLVLKKIWNTMYFSNK